MGAVVLVARGNLAAAVLHAVDVEAHYRVELLAHLHQEWHVLRVVLLRHEVLVVVDVFDLIGSLVLRFLFQLGEHLHRFFIAQLVFLIRYVERVFVHPGEHLIDLVHGLRGSQQLFLITTVAAAVRRFEHQVCSGHLPKSCNVALFSHTSHFGEEFTALKLSLVGRPCAQGLLVRPIELESDHLVPVSQILAARLLPGV